MNIVRTFIVLATLVTVVCLCSIGLYSLLGYVLGGVSFVLFLSLWFDVAWQEHQQDIFSDRLRKLGTFCPDAETQTRDYQRYVDLKSEFNIMKTNLDRQKKEKEDMDFIHSFCEDPNERQKLVSFLKKMNEMGSTAILDQEKKDG